MPELQGLRQQSYRAPHADIPPAAAQAFKYGFGGLIHLSELSRLAVVPDYSISSCPSLHMPAGLPAGWSEE